MKRTPTIEVKVVRKVNKKTVLKLNGEELETIEADGLSLVQVKPICEKLGVDHSGQVHRLKRLRVLRYATVRAMDLKLRRVLCIPVSEVEFWVRTLSVGRVKGHPTKAYFIRSALTGLIKIGTSADALRRLGGLTKYPDRLELLAIGGVEKQLHERLRKHRVWGEWFNPHPDVLSALNALRGKRTKPIATAGLELNELVTLVLYRVLGLSKSELAIWSNAAQRDGRPLASWVQKVVNDHLGGAATASGEDFSWLDGIDSFEALE